MKKYSFITKLAAAFVVVGVSTSAQANGSTPGASQDKTATGSVKLSRPGQLQPAGEVAVGGYSSNVSFSATVAATEGPKLQFESGFVPITVSGAKLVRNAARISNKTIIESAVGVGNARKKSLVLLHEGAGGDSPRLAVYDNSTKSLVKLVDINVLGGVSVDFDWNQFVGIYGGTATITETASATAVVSAGKLTGRTSYTAMVNFDGLMIPMAGVGTFTQTSITPNSRNIVKGGITGSAKLSGLYEQP